MKNIYNKKNNIAVAIFSFNRPEYLKKVLFSLSNNIDIDDLDFYMFQDGSINKFSNRVAGDERDINKCIVEWLTSNLPNKTLIRNSDNLGIGITQYEAKVFLFDKMKYDKVIFLEDDLVLSKYYIRLIKLMLNNYEYNDNIGAVTCHGIGYRNKDREEKQKNLYRIEYGNHQLWGWAMWNNRWKKIKPHFLKYYRFIKDIDYKYRPHIKIKKFYNNEKFNIKQSSQDAAMQYSFFSSDLLVLNTKVNRGQYIGIKGEHMTPEIFESNDYYRRNILEEFEEDRNVAQFEEINIKKAWDFVHNIFDVK